MSDRQASGAFAFARRSVAAVGDRQTWLNFAYLLLAFPLGLFYFVFLVVGLSLGFGLAIVWVGIPILLVMFGAWWAFAAWERITARVLLQADLPAAPRPWESADGLVGKLKAHLTHASTWQDLVFVLLKFPLGLATFVAVTVGVSITAALLLAPAYAPWVHGDVSLNLGLWHIDTWWESLFAIPLGLVAFVISLNVFNGFAALWRLVATGLLADSRRGRRETPAPGTDRV